MNQHFILSLGSTKITLRTIKASDCENIRLWKNKNRISFFYQEIISPQMQEKWFNEYLDRADDYMFVVQHSDEVIGCMGFRLVNGKADVYNVILGNLDYKKKGYMSKAMILMCSYILSNSIQNIGLKVLQSNPAINWYLKIGFYEVSSNSSFIELEFDAKRIAPTTSQEINYYIP